jgi:hypothetical protein
MLLASKPRQIRPAVPAVWVDVHDWITAVILPGHAVTAVILAPAPPPVSAFHDLDHALIL